MRISRKKFKITQALILCGGRGSRLGHLTKNNPKPLLKVSNKIFLDYIIHNLIRHGIKSIFLLCGYKYKKIYKKYHNKVFLGIKIKCLKENFFLGTGGAIVNANKILEKKFIVCNGDTYFNFNLLDFINNYKEKFNACLATTTFKKKKIRYGKVKATKGRVISLGKNLNSNYINTGYYIFSKKDFVRLKKKFISLEEEILSELIKKKKLQAINFNHKNNFFLDIGLPKDFFIAQKKIPKQYIKRAVFLDRDGVINKDLGYVIKKKDFYWNKGVKEGIKLLNQNNFYVFVITNQSGIGRGYYSEKKLIKLHEWINNELSLIGAHIDAFFYAPYFKFSNKLRYRKSKNLRKPNTGMIEMAKKEWPIDLKNSILIGDQLSDIQVAKKAKIKESYLFKKNYNFLRLIKKILPKKT